VLYDFNYVFARSLSEIKRYPHYQLSLQPVFKRQYRLHPDDAKETERQIADMLKTGGVEYSQTAEYNSPIFMVGKSDGSKRVVVDLRGINAIIAQKLIQLPKIPEQIDEVTALKCQYASICDLRSGFWQISLEESSRPLTSFTAPDGMRYQWTVCPFGLQNTPMAVQFVLMTVFPGKMRNAGTYLYMDDLLTVGSAWQDQLSNLKSMFQTLRANNLTCNPTKCTLGNQCVKNLNNAEVCYCK